MKVLGLVASPRKGGNSEVLVKEMFAALPAAANKEMIRLPALDIRLCRACYACVSKDKQCVLKDDLGFLLDKIRQADAVIIASACYFLGPHTSIKNIVDRLLSIQANAEDFAGKKCVTAVTYGVPFKAGYSREAVNNFARFLHLTVVGNMVVEAALPGEAIRDEVLQEARMLVSRLVEPAKEDSSVPGMVVCQGCGSSLLQLAPTGQVRCVMCGARGVLEAVPGGYTIKYTSGRVMFTPEGIAEHNVWQENKKRQFLDSRGEIAEKLKPYDDVSFWVEPPRNS